MLLLRSSMPIFRTWKVEKRPVPRSGPCGKAILIHDWMFWLDVLSGQVNRTNNDDLPEGIEPAINQHRPEVGRWIQIPCSFTLYSLFPVIPFSSSARGVFQDQTNGRLVLVGIAGEHSANCVIKRKKKRHCTGQFARLPRPISRKIITHMTTIMPAIMRRW